MVKALSLNWIYSIFLFFHLRDIKCCRSVRNQMKEKALFQVQILTFDPKLFFIQKIVVKIYGNKTSCKLVLLAMR